ncbi:MAG: hypothetical protein NZ699_07250 [Roseiflexus sp.]|nr:hypothetical protein [Roseiflexus sp.]MCS7288914.1 hypothetical protein [Roseiflexus sp.]MDW8146150.1 hypothetical protein [Roseiflexaceae bacterium]MDW8234261.1 hypothetical protein [Roseiflexaceae bacterium]
MTEPQGLFTIQTSLYLLPEHRARLEHLVRERRSNPPDVVSQILADYPLTQLPSDLNGIKGEPIHMRIYLTPEQRAAFEAHLAAHNMTLSALVSRIVADYLATLPAPPPAPPSPRPTVDLAKRRADLARLKARRDEAGTNAPAWLHAYIAQMEAELRRLEREG